MSGGKDRLLLEGMEFYGYHGDIEAERTLGVRIDVDVEIETDLAQAGQSDLLHDTVNYSACYQHIREIVETRQYHLLEALAQGIADDLLSLNGVSAVRVRVGKRPPLPGSFRRFAVDITRPRG